MFGLPTLATELYSAAVLWKLLPLFVIFLSVLTAVPILVYFERKMCAYIQDRIGPNRVGLLGPDSLAEGVLGVRITKMRVLGGLVQPLADAVKLIFKEDIVPARAERFLFTLAPLFALIPPFLAFAVIPIGDDICLSVTNGVAETFALQIADLHIGILWILCVASLSAYGLSLGGWASNNKFSLMGGIRATAQMISYEIGLGIVILAVIMTYSSVKLGAMVSTQAAGGFWGWGLFHQPLGFLLFVICAFAENNRLPFDLPECEAELVGGFHTEYSSMKFSLFFMGEYVAVVSMGALIACMFLGGWHFPFYGTVQGHLVDLCGLQWGLNIAAALSVLCFAIKVFLFGLFSIWVRWTLPRFRYDQLMTLGWKVLIPLALLNLVVTAFVNL